MPENKERLLRTHFFQQRVINYDPFRSAEAGYIGIEFIGLAAGVLQKHSLGWDIQTGAMGNLDQVIRKLRLGCGERLKFEEHRVNDQRFEKKHREEHRQRQQPEIEPPFAWARANGKKKQQAHHNVKQGS